MRLGSEVAQSQTRELALEKVKVGDFDLRCMGECLRLTASLEVLNLSQVEVQSITEFVLCCTQCASLEQVNMLPLGKLRTNGLEHLDLRGQSGIEPKGFGDCEVALLAGYLPQNSSLLTLDFDSALVTDEHAVCLAEAALKHPKLQRVAQIPVRPEGLVAVMAKDDCQVSLLAVLCQTYTDALEASNGVGPPPAGRGCRRATGGGGLPVALDVILRGRRALLWSCPLRAWPGAIRPPGSEVECADVGNLHDPAIKRLALALKASQIPTLNGHAVAELVSPSTTTVCQPGFGDLEAALVLVLRHAGLQNVDWRLGTFSHVTASRFEPLLDRASIVSFGTLPLLELQREEKARPYAACLGPVLAL